MEYSTRTGVPTLLELTGLPRDQLRLAGDYDIPWSRFGLGLDRLSTLLGSLICGLLCPDRRQHGFAVGFGSVLQSMVWDHTVFVWGPYMLAHMHYHMMYVAYLDGRSLGCGATLLQIWAWEHIVICHPVGACALPTDRPYVYMYDGSIVQTHMGHLSYWRQ